MSVPLFPSSAAERGAEWVGNSLQAKPPFDAPEFAPVYKWGVRRLIALAMSPVLPTSPVFALVTAVTVALSCSDGMLSTLCTGIYGMC